ncbi:MAG TPA: aldehyde dehydrogenase [Deferrisomatales bacterium]|nr:aldehyde dehydrogenase [Deferrisomatales bacterium]
MEQIVDTVVARLRAASSAPASVPKPTPATSKPPAAVIDGVFRDMEDAIRASTAAQRTLVSLPLAARADLIDAIRKAGRDNGPDYARLEWEETGLGKVEDNLKKVIASCSVMGMEDLGAEAFTGDMGLTVIERIPYGVIASINPVTNGAPSIIFNAIMMISGGNTVINNPHPKTAKVSVRVIRDLNKAIVAAGGPPNCICCLEEPSVPSAQFLMTHSDVKMIAVTGGHGVVKFATQTGKRVIAGGPGNPPVVVDETADLDRAADCIIEGASFSNCTPCASEKELFVVESVADSLKVRLKQRGAYELSPEQGAELVKVIFNKVNAPGTPGEINMEYIGKPPSHILKSIGLDIDPETKIAILETDFDHPLIWTEQIMPVIPLIRCADVCEAIDRAVAAEQGNGHTMVIHSTNVKNLARMGSKADCSAFVKNGSSLAGVGVTGEGYTSFHITTNGEGHTRPKTFTRIRRCVLNDDFRLRLGSEELDYPRSCGPANKDSHS